MPSRGGAVVVVVSGMEFNEDRGDDLADAAGDDVNVCAECEGRDAGCE